MNNQIFYSLLWVLGGIISSTLAIIFLTRLSKRIIKFFELYPESKGILRFSLKFITWLIGATIFLVCVNLGLRQLNLGFTEQILENLITMAPRYFLAIVLVLAGFYIARVIRERTENYRFEYKDRILSLIDFIIYMTFIFTALYTIGINIAFFLEFYKVVLWVIGAILALTVSMTLGIPLGISIYEKMRKEKHKKI